MLEMKVKAVVMDQSGDFSVLLTDKDEKVILPIVVGALEAHNILLPLRGETAPRPMTHDLLKSVIESFEGRVEKVVITGIRENTYYAEVHLYYHEKRIVLDARPSDAIALALRFKVPVYMASRLVEFTYDREDFPFREEGNGETH